MVDKSILYPIIIVLFNRSISSDVAVSICIKIFIKTIMV